MRILFISHNFIPQPTSEGSAIHIWTILKAMQELGHKVNLLVYGTTEYYYESGWTNPHKEGLVKTLESRGYEVKILPKKRITTEKSKGGFGASLIHAIKRLISPLPIDFYEGPYYRKEIGEYASEIKADAVVAYSFEATSAACASINGIPIVASTVDLDHVVRRLRKPKIKSLAPKMIAKDLYERVMLMRLSSVEVTLLNQCNHAFSHAAQHCQWLKKHGVKNLVYLPVAVPDNTQLYFNQKKDINSPLRIIMVGAVNATATRMGLRFLTQEMLPSLNALWQKTRAFELQIFGGGKMDEKFRKKLNYEWVKIMGYVEDIGSQFYHSDLLLVPTPDNVGFRTRISEGFSFGCCVITHTANTLGMPELKHMENCLICRTSSDFTSAISKCLESKELRQRLSSAARKTYEEKLDGRKVGERIVSTLEKVIAEGAIV